MDKVLSYFRGLDAVLPPAATAAKAASFSVREHFESAEDYAAFLENLFTEVDGKEYRLCMNHDGSVVAERILLATTLWPEVDGSFYFRVFVDRLGGRFGEMAVHRYASHVVQTVVRCCVSHTAHRQDESVAGLPTVRELVQRIRDELPVSLARDPYGSHVLRDLVDTLDAFHLQSAVDDAHSLAFDAHGSLFLQQYMGRHAVDCSAFVGEAITDKNASRVIEQYLKQALVDSTAFQSFYAEHIRGRLAEYIEHPIANHVIRTLVSLAHSEQQMSLLMGEMREVDFVRSRRCMLLVAMAEWALRSKTLADSIARFIFDAFGLKSTQERKASYTRIQDASPHLLAVMPELSSVTTKSLYDSLLDCSVEDLLSWARDPIKSRPLEAFMTSSALSSRLRLIRRFAHHWCELAMDKIASHIVDAAFASSDINLRNAILEELSAKAAALQASPYGRFVARNCRLEEYMRSREQWRSKEASKETKRRLLSDIIPEVAEKCKPPAKAARKASRKQDSLLLSEDEL